MVNGLHVCGVGGLGILLDGGEDAFTVRWIGVAGEQPGHHEDGAARVTCVVDEALEALRVRVLAPVGGVIADAAEGGVVDPGEFRGIGIGLLDGARDCLGWRGSLLAKDRKLDEVDCAGKFHRWVVGVAEEFRRLVAIGDPEAAVEGEVLGLGDDALRGDGGDEELTRELHGDGAVGDADGDGDGLELALGDALHRGGLNPVDRDGEAVEVTTEISRGDGDKMEARAEPRDAEGGVLARNGGIVGAFRGVDMALEVGFAKPAAFAGLVEKTLVGGLELLAVLDGAEGVEAVGHGLFAVLVGLEGVVGGIVWFHPAFADDELCPCCASRPHGVVGENGTALEEEFAALADDVPDAADSAMLVHHDVVACADGVEVKDDVALGTVREAEVAPNGVADGAVGVG